MATARRKFVKTIGGQESTEYASTEADAVRLSYNGWREVTPTQAANSAKTGTTKKK